MSPRSAPSETTTGTFIACDSSTERLVRGAIGSVLVIPPRVRKEDDLDARVAHSLDAGLEPGHAEVPFGGAFPWELP